MKPFAALLAVALAVAFLLPSAHSQDRPNILWITSEDNSISWVGCYGSPNAKTPNLDKLAEEGFRYTHCFDNAAVCAPTRSTWITGLYAISMGTQPMRSRYDIPHDLIPYYPDQLHKAGYFISNGGKTDYNVGSRPDKETWEVGGSHWTQRKDRQPFFVIKNIGDSHESRAFPPKSGNKNASKAVQTDPATMKLHRYHPDLPGVRETYARYADAVGRMDTKVGEILAQLEADGLADDTIVVYCSDHGGVLARSKRFVYSSGTHCPLIIRIPEKWKAWWPAEKPGMTVDRIVSFVDMPKTWLSLAGAEIPPTYQGTIFLGPDTEEAPKHHLSFRERADECFDMVRGMRDERYAYIKNYMPWAPNGQHLKYMFTMTATQAWRDHFLAGKCDEVTGRFFRPRVSEEFYDTVEDFDNVDNRIGDPTHADKIAELKSALRKRQLELFDSGLVPEPMRVRRAAAAGVTQYAMVRDPDLYPLAKYLDYADKALERAPANLETFVETLGSDSDEAMRYWAICGLFLLDDQAKPATGAIKKAAAEEPDSGEVILMAAWALHRLGEADSSKAAFERIGDGNEKSKEGPVTEKRYVECVLKWRDWEDQTKGL